MTNVIGGMAAKGLAWLFDQFAAWLYEWVYAGLSKFIDSVLQLLTTATNRFWDVPVIERLLDFSAWINTVVLAISLLFLIMEIVEQSDRVNWAIVFSNLVKGLLFVLFNRYIGLATYTVSQTVIEGFDIDLQTPTFSGLTAMLSACLGGITGGFFVTFMVVVVFAAFIAFFVMSLLRCGTLFVQIFSSSFYIPSIIQGDTAKMGDWLRQTIAISATYFLQYLLFYIGLDSLTGVSPDAFITTAVCWTTMFFVPKILGQFGYSSGASSVISAAGSLVQSGLSFVK